MKRGWFIIAGMLAGMFVGWMWPMVSTRVEEKVSMSPVARRNGGVRPNKHADAVSDLPFRVAGDQVWIARDRLEGVLGTGTSTLLKMSGFKTIENGRIVVAGFESICSRLGMDPGESKDFHRILNEAADARFQWEKENVKGIKTGPAEWEIRVPGDGGKAVEALRGKLKGRFGPERLEAIDLLADLGRFFQTEYFETGFRHGVMKIRARLGDEMENNRLVVELGVETPERTVGFRFDERSLDQIEFVERYAGFIGGADAIRNAVRHGKDR